jgi:uncharacterized phage-like protein YoqJ
MITIAFTGHRPNKLWGYNEDRPEYDRLFEILINTIEKIIQEHPEEKDFILVNGMAIGVDQLACAASYVVREKLKKVGKNIMIEAAIPCLHQEAKWPARTQGEYHALLRQVDKITYVHKGEYNYFCMNDRNKYMVDKADYVIAVWNGSAGGTGNCVKYAQSKNKNIIMINPTDI